MTNTNPKPTTIKKPMDIFKFDQYYDDTIINNELESNIEFIEEVLQQLQERGITSKEVAPVKEGIMFIEEQWNNYSKLDDYLTDTLTITIRESLTHIIVHMNREIIDNDLGMDDISKITRTFKINIKE